MKHARWHWDIAEIEAQDITDNVVELMIGKLKKLPESAQHVLRLAACVGNRFDLDPLSVIFEKSVFATFQYLMPALTEGLILPTSEPELGSCDIHNSQFIIRHSQFLHDRVQQAAYALIEDDQKQAVHLRIGRLLLANTPAEEQPEKIFEMVEHLNKGRELMTEAQEKVELANLNLFAGKKAKDVTAYAAAFQYLTIGIDCLSGNFWTEHYDLTLALYKEQAEVEHLNGHFEQSETFINLILTHTKTALEKAEIYNLLVIQYTMLAKYKEAILVGRKALQLLGIDLPDENLPAALEVEFAKAKDNLSGKKIASLLAEPEMTIQEKKVALKLLMNIDPPAYYCDQALYPVIIAKSVNLSLQYGNIAESSKGYATYGILVGSILGDYQSGYEFGVLAVKLSEKLKDLAQKCKSCLILGNFLNVWAKPLKSAESINNEGYQAGLESGELQFAGYILMHKILNSFVQGTQLAEILAQLSNFLLFSHKTNNRSSTGLMLAHQLPILNLSGLTANKFQFGSDEMTETQYLEMYQSHQDAYCVYNILKAKVFYLYGQFDDALWHILEAEKLLAFLFSLVPTAEHNFHYSLILVAIYPKASTEEQKHYWEKLETHQKQMKIWVDSCPENFLHKYLLVDAEMAGLTGKELEVTLNLYDQAIASACKNEFVQDEALCNELAAKFWLEKGKEEFAQVYLKRAHYGYQQWGATAKIAELEAKYPHFLAQQTSRPVQTNVTISATRMASTSTQSTSNLLDLSSVVKASQTLSGEIVLSRLLEKMMQIVIENAGAEKGFLLLPQNDNWFIEAEGHVDSYEVTVLQSLALETSDLVSTNIIHYVARTQENVVLHDATREGTYQRDPYIIKQRPKSVLCAPLVNQRQLTGLLYLENNLATGAFTPERLEVLNVLSSQLAISIENSLLYNNLELKVTERTSELAQRTYELEQEVVERQRAEEAAKVANQAKSTFLANMSHELRSPLNAVLGFAQLMASSRKLEPEDQENIGIIRRSGEHLLTLINQVLDLSKIEAGRTTLNETHFDFYRLLDDLEDMFRLKADDKHLQLIFEREPSVSQHLYADEVKVRQVLINLLNNALKFTFDGGITVRINAKAIARSDLNRQRSLIEFEVEDTGSGIAPDELDDLFKAFVQTSTGKQSQEGTGLGLPISRKFVQLMGGDMVVNSEVGRGTTFKFHLVCQLSEATNIQQPTLDKRVIALAPNQPRYRILIVDDKWPSRQLLIKLLNPLGFELKEAENGQQAVDLWDDWQPHLIWMDMRMPVMDGYEATLRIREHTKGQATAIIALTASVLEEERTVILDVGCDDFLRKPFKENDIFDAMHKHLGVEYIYEEPIEAPMKETEGDALTPNNIATLPTELLARFEDATDRNDLDMVESIINEIRLYNVALAKGLTELADVFDYDAILDLIREAQGYQS